MRKILFVISLLIVHSIAHARSVITPSDFTYLGGFRTPLVDEDPRGLTIRYKNGTPYLYTTIVKKNIGGAATDLHLIEMGIPSLQPVYSSFQRATVSNNYGDIWGTALREVVSNGSVDCESSPCIGVTSGTALPSGIYWDETDQRMYWTKVVNYNNTYTTSDTSTGYSTLNDTTITGTGVASWKLATPYNSSTNPTGIGGRWASCVFAIPSSVASEIEGRRIGLGAGGGVSIIGNGKPSLGPAVFAIKPPSTGVEAAYGYLANAPTPLMHHLFTRATRSANYPGLNKSSGDATYGATDKWWAEDQTFHGVWISETNKHGFISIGKIGGGNLDTTITSFNSSTSITVDSVGDTRPGDLLRIDQASNGWAGYNYERKRVSTVNGNTITLESPLSESYSPGDLVQAGTWYFGGGPEETRLYTMAYIYSEDDLLSVAKGLKNADALTPTYNELWSLPTEIPNPAQGKTAGSDYRKVKGITYDSSSKRLYVMFSTQDVSNPSDVFVYQLNDTQQGSRYRLRFQE